MTISIRIILFNLLFLIAPTNAYSTTISFSKKEVFSQKDTTTLGKRQSKKTVIFRNRKLFKSGLIFFLIGVGLVVLGTSNFIVSFMLVLFLIAAQIALITGLIMMLLSLAPPAQSRRFKNKD
jgi:hypothetical protein